MLTETLINSVSCASNSTKHIIQCCALEPLAYGSCPAPSRQHTAWRSPPCAALWSCFSLRTFYHYSLIPHIQSPSSILSMSYISDRLISFLPSSLVISHHLLPLQISSFLLPSASCPVHPSISISSNSPRLG